MKEEKKMKIFLYTGIMVVALALILTISGTAGAEYGGEFVDGDEKNADPGESVTMRIMVRNTGDEDTEFRLDDPELPPDWDFQWKGGDNKTIPADSGSDFTIMINVSEDNDKAKAGEYQFEITGEYDTDTGSEAIPGSCYLNITVNAVYGVRVSADDTSDSADPGETVTYMAEIRNTGNIHETYQLLLLNPSGLEDASDWTTIDGAEPGDQLTIPVGGTKFIDLVVEVPDFTAENDEAKNDLFGVKLKAKSQNDTDIDSEVTFQLEVEEFYNISQWPDNPGRDGKLKGNEDTEFTFSLHVRNLGNTDDSIEISLPGDELMGEKKDWVVRFDGQHTKTLALDSLEKTTIAVDVTVDRDTKPGDYTLRIRGKSNRDSSVTIETLLYINLTKANYRLRLEKIPTGVPQVNPVDEEVIEFRFYLYNEGDAEDSYTIRVETSTAAGTYKDWIMEFENKEGERVDSISIPNDLPGQTDEYLPDGERVEFSFYVMVDIHEDEGDFSDICISAQSDNDDAQISYYCSNLTVIKPNIRVSDDPYDFSIDPDSDIEVGDSIDIIVRVYNDGSAETDEFWVWFYNGKTKSPPESVGTDIAREKVDNIQAGSYTDVLVTWDNIPGGENDIYVYADKPIKSGSWATKLHGKFSPDGSILEARENDNYASIADQYQEAIDLRPDLTVLSLESDDNKTGESTTVTVTIANIGSAPVEQSTASVKVKINGEYIKEKRTNSQSYFIAEEIAVNDDIDVEFLWNVPDEVRKFTVKVTVDLLDDSYPVNNRITAYIQTRSNGTDPSVTDPVGPDLYIVTDDIHITNTQPEVGEKIMISILARNKGDTSADATISLYLAGINGTLLKTKEIYVSFGGESSLAVYWEPGTAGDQVFTIIVGDVHPKDNDDTNNHAEFTIKVLEEGGSDDSDDSPFPSVMIVVATLGCAVIWYRSRRYRSM